MTERINYSECITFRQTLKCKCKDAQAPHHNHNKSAHLGHSRSSGASLAPKIEANSREVFFLLNCFHHLMSDPFRQQTMSSLRCLKEKKKCNFHRFLLPHSLSPVSLHIYLQITVERCTTLPWRVVLCCNPGSFIHTLWWAVCLIPLPWLRLFWFVVKVAEWHQEACFLSTDGILTSPLWLSCRVFCTCGTILC